MRNTDAINIIESVLRDLIREVIGEGWKTHPKIDVTDLEQKRTDDQQKRPGLLGTPPLINYLEFWHLSAIINRNWAKFEPILEHKRRFSLDMDRLANFRNPTMHSRDLLEYEEHLVLGLTEMLRVQITKYRSEKGPDEMYYPNIIRIKDTTRGEALADGHRSEAVLTLGDRLSYRCSATDPQGRLLYWALRVENSNHSLPIVHEADGNDVLLSWAVDHNNVMDTVTTRIEVASDGRYHRRGEYDDSWHFYYTVLPPRI